MSAAKLNRDARGRVTLIAPCCPLPHGVVLGKCLRITSRHEKERHALDLTPDDLRQLADELEEKGGPTRRVTVSASSAS